MNVSDANLLIYLLVPGPHTSNAQRVRAAEKVWYAPSLLLFETMNVLGNYVSRGAIHLDEAVISFQRATSLVRISSAAADARWILKTSVETKCSAYDLQYVWLANELNIPLVTADRQVLTTFPAVAISIEDFASQR